MHPAEEVLSASEADTQRLAGRLAARCSVGDVVALSGPLGAGKTAFLRGFAAELGLASGEAISSPSYALVHTHALATRVRGATELAHLDLYRLDDDESFDALGVEDLLDHAILAIEWAEQVPRAAALATWWVTLEERGPEERLIRLRKCRG